MTASQYAFLQNAAGMIIVVLFAILVFLMIHVRRHWDD